MEAQNAHLLGLFIESGRLNTRFQAQCEPSMTDAQMQVLTQ